MAEFNEVQDSGKRQEFNTGSVRDTAEGKGTPHLIAGEALAKVHDYIKTALNFSDGYLYTIQDILFRYSEFVVNREDNIGLVYEASAVTMEFISKEQENNSYSATMRRLAKHYENGSRKYSANNWRKGQPVSRYYDSAMRHLWSLMDDKTDEDHASALLWNLIGIIQTKIDVKKELLSKELDNFPFTIDEVFKTKN